MIKTTVNIDGMMCGMCEAHINDTIRKVYPSAKKVASSRKKGESTFLLDVEADETKLKAAIDETGYKYKSMQSASFSYIFSCIFRKLVQSHSFVYI